MDQHTVLTLIDAGLQQCSLDMSRDGGLFTSLFMAGLVGGWSHCAGMCGPFVLAQVATRLEGIPASRMTELHRLTGAAVLPYHFGRATTYAGIGAMGALLAGGVAALPGLRWFSVALLGFAALFFLSYAVSGLLRQLPRLQAPGFAVRAQHRWAERVSAFARPLFGSPTGWRGYGLGLALGFIPCGLLYGAVAVASASGNPLSGALGMAAFAAGTVPSLLTVGLAGHAAGRTFRGVMSRVAPIVMAVNAGVLGYMAWRLIV